MLYSDRPVAEGDPAVSSIKRSGKKTQVIPADEPKAVTIGGAYATQCRAFVRDKPPGKGKGSSFFVSCDSSFEKQQIKELRKKHRPAPTQDPFPRYAGPPPTVEAFVPSFVDARFILHIFMIRWVCRTEKGTKTEPPVRSNQKAILPGEEFVARSSATSRPAIRWHAAPEGVLVLRSSFFVGLASSPADTSDNSMDQHV